MTPSASFSPAPRGVSPLLRSLVVSLVVAGLVPVGLVRHSAGAGPGHLVISEIVTGGAGASDELIELYNPSAVALPLEGLELVYVSASGATVTRRVGWELGAASLAPGAHLLVANEVGVFAPIADAVYAGGMAATGGSVALRIQGATMAVDAVGWGAASGAWLEGGPAPAPSPGASIERLPGGIAGSTVDTGDNAADFVVRTVPDPQNAGSPPVPGGAPSTPSATPSPTATAIATESPAASATPMPSQSPSPTISSSVPIGAARALPDGTTVSIDGIALTGSGFTDGGGFVADASGGIAILVDEGSFARGERVHATGTVDDRFAQRTLRATAVAVQTPGEPPPTAARATGAVNEAVEGRMVRLDATIDGGPTELSGGLAFDLDDGSGVARVVIGAATGIDTAGWVDGRRVAVVGVVGQRDSSGTGTSGYRVQPRDPADVELLAGPSPTPTPGGASASPQPSPTAPGSAGDLTSIAAARAAAPNARLTIRGVVTLASATIDPDSAVLQDASGAILLRLGDEIGRLDRGELVEVHGVRSTKGGMESLRATEPPRRIGTAAEPAARALRTGDAGEAAEAQLVVARGALVASARRASSGTVSFEIDDGSGPLRVVLGAALGAGDDHLVSGSWVEVVGVLGQETTGSQPTSGYRVWPRAESELRVLAGPAGTSDGLAQRGAAALGSEVGGAAPEGSLASIGTGSLADLRIGATLVAGAWPELELGGLLWDGSRLVGVDSSSHDVLERALASRRPPVSLELGRVSAVGTHPQLATLVVTLGAGTDDVVVATAAPAPPLTRLPARDEPAAWVSVVGRLSRAGDRTTLAIDGASVEVDRLCGERQPSRIGVASVRGIAMADPLRIIVPCDGIGPAPELGIGPKAAGAAPGDPVGEPAVAGAVGTAASPQRAIAIVLLGAGVAALVLGRLVVRRLGPSDAPDATGEEPDEGEEVATGSDLTLVRLPREHGP